MKFVCLNCETYMNFEKVEKPGEGTLGVFFGCPSCNAKFSMVTNPGETQMVSSLGVKLGGRTVEAEPFEMTRGTLKDEATTGAGQMAGYLNEKIQGGQPAVAAATAAPAAKHGEKPSGGCPFSAMVAEMGLTSGGRAGYRWSGDLRVFLVRRCEGEARSPSFICETDGAEQCRGLCPQAGVSDDHVASDGRFQERIEQRDDLDA